ncbi:MAG TPA: DsbA family protein [Polyangiaceae bacterium]|nr:DsbA family protein [Polyangiaceae bacterium]
MAPISRSRRFAVGLGVGSLAFASLALGSLVLAGIGCTSTAPAAPLVDAGAAPLVKVPIGSSPLRGPIDAWVTMVEFADFECPFCGEEEPVVEALLQAYPADLRLVFKNFPLTTIHPYAEGAAIAAECAGQQGDFWPMHDILFANQNALESTNLPGYAQEAGVDVPTWQACLTTEPPIDAINADVALGTSIGVDGTPTFVINGQMIVGAVPQSELQGVIETSRAAAEASGVPSSEYYDEVILGED